MSQFSAVMLVNSNGQYVNPDDLLTIDDVNYCMAEILMAKDAKHAVDQVQAMVFSNDLLRKLLFYKAVRFVICETSDELVVIEPVNFNYLDPVSRVKH